jgi:hypothetical protein
LLFQDWNTTLNSYRFGADLKILKGTVISYDQFLDYYKGDTTWQLAPFAQARLPGTSGTVEVGLPIDPANKTPCAINSPASSLIDSAGTLTNPACNAYFDYRRTNRARTSQPTERLSLHSTYFQRLDLAASYAYSSADMNAPLDEFFNGLIQRSSIRQETVTGPVTRGESQMWPISASLSTGQNISGSSKPFASGLTESRRALVLLKLTGYGLILRLVPCSLQSAVHTERNQYLRPIVIQPELEEEPDRSRLGCVEAFWRPHRIQIWRPGVSSGR